jgi:hypothetical protein
MNPTQTWPFDKYYNIIINLGILMINRNFEIIELINFLLAIRGRNVDDNIFPQDYLTDYVRVYAASKQSFPKVSILAKANSK